MLSFALPAISSENLENARYVEKKLKTKESTFKNISLYFLYIVLWKE